jgi:hypothetical protein
MKSCRVRVVRCWILKMTTFVIIHNIALFLLVGHLLNCGRNIHSSGIRDENVCSINAIRVFLYCHILRPSPHSVNLFSSVSAIVRLWQEFDGVIFIGVVVRLWELNHVALGTIFISCFQVLGHPLNSSIFVSSRCWAIVLYAHFRGSSRSKYAC